jgi:hypothetical protein
MRAEGEEGIFQKMLRDSAVVSLFDGSEPVCLDSLASQLPLMARARRRPRQEDWARLYDLRVTLEEFHPERVTVFGRGEDAVFASLPALAEQLDAVPADAHCHEGRLGRLRSAVTALQDEVDRLFARVEAAREDAADGQPAERRSIKDTPVHLVHLAVLSCALHAKVACLGMWLHNREHLGEQFAAGAWLEAALHRTTGERADVGSLPPALTEHLYAQLVAQLEDAAYFSLLPIAQAVPAQAA